MDSKVQIGPDNKVSTVNTPTHVNFHSVTSGDITKDVKNVKDKKVEALFEKLMVVFNKYHEISLDSCSVYFNHEITDEINKIIQSTLEIGWASVEKLFLKWPDDKKGNFWFDAQCFVIFKNVGACDIPVFLESMITSADADTAPTSVYRTILEKLLQSRGYLNSESFIGFMSSLVEWNVLSTHPAPEILRNIPLRTRETRPDFPDIKSSPTNVNSSSSSCCDNGCWGGRNKVLEREYLPKTILARHSAMITLLHNAPKEYLIPLLDHWLNDSGAEFVRKSLFCPVQHPISVAQTEIRPWNIMLEILKRVTPELTSEFLQALRNYPSCQTQKLEDNYFQSLCQGARITIFGRTIGLLKNTGNIYLKFQAGDEDDQEFIMQASRYQYIDSYGEKMGLKTKFARLKGVYRIENLNNMLSFFLSEIKQIKALAVLCLKCSSESLVDIYKKHFNGHSTYTDCLLFENNKTDYLESDLLDDEIDGPLLTKQEKKILISYLLEKSKRPSLVMMIETDSDCHYQQYIYQAETAQQALDGLTDYAYDYARLFSFGLLGPDVCSSFHNVSQDRKYYFLPHFFHYPSTGSIESWDSVSTDFPNVGCRPFTMRDMGDIKTAEECRDGWLDILEADLALKKNIHRLESIAKAIWGSILEYGRINRNRFDHTSRACVAKVKQDIKLICSTFLVNAFGIEQQECMSLLENYDLVAQASREMSYWMSSHYAEDLRKGLIPESVYPEYPGKRSGLRLCDVHRKFLYDEGFKGGQMQSAQLGGANGRMPLVALDSVVIFMLSHGCLNLVNK